MPPRGQPFDPQKGRKRLILHCPLCGDVLVPKVIVALGPQELGRHVYGSKPLEPPFYRYHCANSPRCDYVEVQGHLLLVEEDHP